MLQINVQFECPHCVWEILVLDISQSENMGKQVLVWSNSKH